MLPNEEHERRMALYTTPQGARGMYQTGECCTEEGHVWRCLQDGTAFPPSQLPVAWEDLGEV